MSVRISFRNAVLLGSAWALLASPWAMAQTSQIETRELRRVGQPQTTEIGRSAADAEGAKIQPAPSKARPAPTPRKSIDRGAAQPAPQNRELKAQPQQGDQPALPAVQAQKERQFKRQVSQLANQLAGKRAQLVQKQLSEIERENALTLARIRQMAKSAAPNTTKVLR